MNDRAAAGALHVRRHEPARAHRVHQVDPVARVPVGLVLAVGQGGGVVDEDVDPAERVGGTRDEPGQLLAGADATVFTSPDSTLNLRLSTPNKLWESLAGGAPVVYGVGLAEVGAVLAPEGLGIAVAPDDPVAIAAALRTLLDAPPAERAARRARARTLAAERYAWDIRMPEYLALVDRRVPRP